jgi:hypothetical protein
MKIIQRAVTNAGCLSSRAKVSTPRRSELALASSSAPRGNRAYSTTDREAHTTARKYFKPLRVWTFTAAM